MHCGFCHIETSPPTICDATNQPRQRAHRVDPVRHTVRQQIIILAVAMGLQAVVGQMISLSTIVFTTTLTRLIGGIADAIATRSSTGMRDIGEQVTLIASYLVGALLAGVLIVRAINGVVLLPLAGIAVALGAHQLRDRRA